MKCSVLNVCECLILFVCVCRIAEAAEDECKLPEDKLGKCVELPACHPYVALLKESTTTELGLRMTQERRCGLEGVNVKVCCPTEDEEAKTRTSPESDEDDYVDELPAPADCGRYKIEQAPYVWNGQPVKDRPIPHTDQFPSSNLQDTVTYYDQQYSMHMPPPLPEPLPHPSFPKMPPNSPAQQDVQHVWHGNIVKNHQMAQWMALLAYRTSDFASSWDCGGSIITKKHVLTAAHCIRDSLYVVRVGELDLAQTNKDFSPIDFRIKKKIAHENYTKFHNDIGILIVDGTIPIDGPSSLTYIWPVCLPEAGSPYEREGPLGTFITGWGENEEQGRRPTNLLYAYLDVLDQQECRQTYADEALTIDERVFCAGDRNKGRDACNGDSGGPFIGKYYLPDYHRMFFYQIGLISYGYRCSAGRFTGVYTNITYFMPWISEKVTGKKSPRQWTITTQAPILWFGKP